MEEVGTGRRSVRSRVNVEIWKCEKCENESGRYATKGASDRRLKCEKCRKCENAEMEAVGTRRRSVRPRDNVKCLIADLKAHSL